MPTMRALRKTGRGVAVCAIPIPAPAADEVRVRVRLAGLCRTDSLVARGDLPCPAALTLGHEFAGEIDAVGPGAIHLKAGDRVAVLPVFGCRACAVCRAGDEINCPTRTMLGVEHDGAFAEFVVVPARCAFALPAGVDWPAAAYAEPVAAALAVLNAGLRPEQRGLLLGRNRFAALLERVLRAHGFGHLTRYAPGADEGPAPPDDSQDFVVETEVPGRELDRMLAWLRPGGTLVLKSRLPGAVSFPVLPALLKQLTIRAVNYGPFPRALALLAEGRLDLRDLFGPAYPLEAFAEAFARDAREESVKLFFDPAARDVWHRR